jgi:antimicrobial peptide system SdpB family protein
LTSDPVWFQVIFHLGILCTLLFTLGWRTRFITPLTWMFTWSVQQRNPMILDGGDNLMILVLVYLMVVDTGRYLAIDSAARRGGNRGDRLPYRIGTLLHNAGLAAIVLQVVVVYWASGMYKVQGELWQNGTALYYIMRVSEFTWPGWSELVWRNGLLVGLLTHATVLFQVAFPLLLLRRETRVLAVLGGIALHGGIAVFMGLISFSAVMISTELVLISDRRYHQIVRMARRASERVRRAAGRATAGRAERTDPLPPDAPITNV